MGADVNAPSESHGAALKVAASGGHYRIVQRLIEHGADVNAVYNDSTALLSAARGNFYPFETGHLPVVQLLIDNGADVNQRAGQWMALQMAAENGRYDIVQELIENGADVNAVYGLRGTGLCAAALSGHRNVVQLLIENGADINLRDSKIWTALHTAVRWNYQGIVQTLIVKAAEATFRNDREGYTLRATTENQSCPWYGDYILRFQFHLNRELGDLTMKHRKRERQLGLRIVSSGYDLRQDEKPDKI